MERKTREKRKRKKKRVDEISQDEKEKFQVGVKEDHFEGYENRALHADFGA